MRIDSSTKSIHVSRRPHGAVPCPSSRRLHIKAHVSWPLLAFDLAAPRPVGGRRCRLRRAPALASVVPARRRGRPGFTRVSLVRAASSGGQAPGADHLLPRRRRQLQPRGAPAQLRTRKEECQIK